MKRQDHPINGALSLLLIALFAVFSLLLVLIGVQAYTAVTNMSDDNQMLRASLSYVANKVRSAPETVTVEEREGTPVLVLSREVGEEAYETIVYFYEGALKEQFGKKDRTLSFAEGEVIAQLRAFSMQVDEDSLQVTVQSIRGENYEMSLFLPFGREEARS